MSRRGRRLLMLGIVLAVMLASIDGIIYGTVVLLRSLLGT